MIKQILGLIGLGLYLIATIVALFLWLFIPKVGETVADVIVGTMEAINKRLK